MTVEVANSQCWQTPGKSGRFVLALDSKRLGTLPWSGLRGMWCATFSATTARATSASRPACSSDSNWAWSGELTRCGGGRPTPSVPYAEGHTHDRRAASRAHARRVTKLPEPKTKRRVVMETVHHLKCALAKFLAQPRSGATEGPTGPEMEMDLFLLRSWRRAIPIMEDTAQWRTPSPSDQERRHLCSGISRWPLSLLLEV